MQNRRIYMHYFKSSIFISCLLGNAGVSKRSILVTYIPILCNHSDIGYFASLHVIFPRGNPFVALEYLK